MVTSVLRWPSSSSMSSISSSRSSGSIAAQRSSRHLEGVRGLRDVVDPEHGRATLECEHRRGQRRGDAIMWVVAAGEPGQERLARRSDHDLEAERGDLVEPPEQLEVVLERLAEADAGVDGDPVFRDALADRERRALLEER